MCQELVIAKTYEQRDDAREPVLIEVVRDLQHVLRAKEDGHGFVAPLRLLGAATRHDAGSRKRLALLNGGELRSTPIDPLPDEPAF